MNNDLISRSALKEVLKECAYSYDGVNTWIMKDEVLGMIDNAPTVEIRDNFDIGYVQGLEDGQKRPQGDWIEKRVPVGYDYGDTNKRLKEADNE